MKNDFLADALNMPPKVMDEKHNTVSNMLGNVADTIEYGSVDLTEAFPEIPIDWIKPREVNDYTKQRIDVLAQNIEEIGLLNPIIVIPNVDKSDGYRFIISDGERRFTAVQYLKEKYEAEGDSAKAAMYSKIRARILTKKEIKNEEKVHRSANDMARDNTVWERIYRMYPRKDLFTNEETGLAAKIEYANMIEPDGYEKYVNGQIRIKYNNSDIYNYYWLKFKQYYPDIELGSAVVKKYVLAITASCDELNRAVLDTKITPRLSIEIARLPLDEQREKVERILAGESAKEVVAQAAEPQQAAELTDKQMIQQASKTLDRFYENNQRVFEIPQKGMNGNEKEYLRQLKRILRDIETLMKMPQK